MACNKVNSAESSITHFQQLSFILFILMINKEVNKACAASEAAHALTRFSSPERCRDGHDKRLRICDILPHIFCNVHAHAFRILQRTGGKPFHR
jgi:hypothetical protein